jgi:hypothetical protein
VPLCCNLRFGPYCSSVVYFVQQCATLSRLSQTHKSSSRNLKPFAYAKNWQCLVIESTWKSFDPRRHSLDAKYYMLQTCEIRMLHGLCHTRSPLTTACETCMPLGWTNMMTNRNMEDGHTGFSPLTYCTSCGIGGFRCWRFYGGPLAPALIPGDNQSI